MSINMIKGCQFYERTVTKSSLDMEVVCKNIDNCCMLLTGHCFIQYCVLNTGQECAIGQAQKKGSQTDGNIRTKSSEIL